jgi:hypothetical protein
MIFQERALRAELPRETETIAPKEETCLSVHSSLAFFGRVTITRFPSIW